MKVTASAACMIAGCLVLAASLFAVPLPENEAADSAPLREYRLRLHHTHTGESIDIVYRRGDIYIDDALTQLDYHLRDHRNGDILHFDPRLFDLLADLAALVGRPDDVFEVICGYRSPDSNAQLRQSSSGIAEHSLHMDALAIDIRMPGVKTSVLRDAALELHRGGVGYYAASDFIHVDIGRVRSW